MSRVKIGKAGTRPRILHNSGSYLRKIGIRLPMVTAVGAVIVLANTTLFLTFDNVRANDLGAKGAAANSGKTEKKDRAASSGAAHSTVRPGRGRGDDDKEQMECRLPVEISLHERDGVFVRCVPYEDSDLREESRLVSINGQPMRGKSVEEIRRLCTGSDGESAVVGVLDRDGEYQSVTFKCKWMKKTPSSRQDVNQLRSMLYHFDCTNGPHWESGPNRSMDNYDAGDLDLFIAASCQDHLTLAMDDPATSAALVDSVAVGAVGPLLTTGNLPQARRYLKIIETTPAFETEKPRQLDKEYGRLFTMLNLCGLSAKAVKIGGPVIDADQAGKFYRRGGLPFLIGEARPLSYKGYLRNLAATKSADIGRVAEYTRVMGIGPGVHGPNKQIWLGDFYESIGQSDKAIASYETALSEWEHPSGRTYTKEDSPDKQVSEARQHCYLLVRLSQFADQQNATQKAVDYLLRAQQIYISFYSEKQLVAIESQSSYSPSPSAVELALASAFLKLGDSDAATKVAKAAVERLQQSAAGNANAVPKVPGDKEIIDGIKSGKWKDQVEAVAAVPERGEPTGAERAYMSVFMQAQAAIAGGDTAKARPLINILLDQYKKHELTSEYPRPSVNMFCTLLYLARQLADQRSFQDSNNLLDRLRDTGSKADDSPITAVFIDIEKALNAELASRPDPALWRKVWEHWNCSYTDYECLRALACLYLAAGENNRATIMIDEGIKLCKNNSGGDSKGDTSININTNPKAAFTAALLRLDKACLNSTTVHYDLAQKDFAMALAAVDAAPVSAASRDLDLFNRMFMCRAVQLAQQYRLAGKTAEAQNILKEIISRVDNKKSWLGVFEVTDRPSIDTSQSYLYGYYGRLLSDAGKFSAARPHLDKAVAGCRNNVPGFLRLVRARCAAGQGDYAVAAEDMSALAQRSDIFGVSLMSVQPGWKEAYSRLALDYALKAKAFDAEKLSKIYRELANTLNDESSKTEKLDLNEKAYALMPDSSREKGQLAQEIANQSTMLGQGKKEGAGQPDAASEFKMREAAAMLAEKNKDANAAQLWMSLAGSEVQAKQYDQAITHINRAIETQDTRTGYGLEGFQFPALSDWPIRALADAGRTGNAELLYKKLLEKNRSLYTPKSVGYSCVLAQCVIFYAGQKNRVKAMDYLDQLLALDPRRQELAKSGQNGRNTLMDGAYGLLYKDGQNAVAREVMEKLLETQRKTYGSDDSHVSNVLAKMGTLETKDGAYDQAEKHLKEALSIDALYGYEPGFGGSSAKSAMQSLLGKENKTAELQTLNASWQSERKETERHWLLAENASEERAQEFYNWWHQKGPYGYRCLSAAMKLLDSAVKKKDWDRVRELAPECIKILSHNSLSAVGGCTPSPQPGTRKFYCYKSMIQACINSGHPAEASKWLDRAVSEESYEALTEEFLFLCEIENACGNKKEALAYCKRAEVQLPKGSGWNFYRWPVAEMYKKLGAEDDIKRIQADQRADMLIKQEEDLRKFEVQFKEKAKQDALRKQPPAVALPDTRTAAVGRYQVSDENWSAEPKETIMFPPVEEIKDRYLFNYAAYATEDLWLKEGARVALFRGRMHMPAYSFAGSYTGMSCFQPLHHAGQFMFLYDGLPGSLQPKFDMPAPLGRGAHSGGGMTQTPITRIFRAALPVMARPLMAALEAPTTAQPLPAGNDRIILKAGDFTAEHVSINSLVLCTPGRVRIFLRDAHPPAPSMYLEKQISILQLQEGDDPSIKPVFEATHDSCVNLVPPYETFYPRSSLELWYNGKGLIRLGDKTNFTGLIYAPNAVIRLGKNVRFWGAMVADKIIVGEESTIMYQTNLQNWVLEQPKKP